MCHYYRHIPVSYTHLDVYKRQVLNGIAGGSADGFQNQSIQSLSADRVRRTHLRFSLKGQGVGCLLYTSLTNRNAYVWHTTGAGKTLTSFNVGIG